MIEIVYKGNKIAQFGDNDYTAFVFADDDSEDIIEKNFTDLESAKRWVDEKVNC